MEQINVGSSVMLSKEFLDLNRGRHPSTKQKNMIVVRIKGTTCHCVTEGKKTPNRYHVSFLKLKD